MPPSIEALQQRLQNRQQDSAEVIARRVAAAREEMSHVAEFDYVTINDIFEVALHDLLAVIRAQRLKRDVQLRAHATLREKLI